MAATVGTLIISAFTASAAEIGALTVIGTLTVAQVVGAAALVAASYALQSALAPGSSLSPAKQEANLKQTVAPRRRYYGRVKVGGTFVFWRAKDGYFYLFLDLVDDQIEAFDELRLDDKAITIDGSGAVLTPTEFTFANVKRVKVFTQLGTPDQTALPAMTAAWPGVWTADHRLRGVATALVVAQTVPAANFTAVYPQGEPSFTAIIRGALVFDPRDPAQSYADKSTWAYSDNYALCLLDFLLHPDGMAFPYSLVEPALEDWAARADDCDEEMDLAAGGTEPRFRLWGGYELDEPRKAVLQRILDASGGDLVQRSDGAPILRLPRFYNPNVVLDDEVVSTFATLRPGPDMGDRYNEIRAKVVFEGTDWQQDEADPWRDEASISAEGLQTRMLDLSMCPSHRQARVRMKLEAYRANPKWLGTAVTNAYGMNAIGEQLVRLEKSAYNFDEVIELTGFEIDPATYACQLNFRAMPADAFAWSTDEEGTSPEAQDQGDPDATAAPTGLNVVVSYQGYATGVEAGQLVATVDNPGRDDYLLYGEWRVHNGAISDDAATWTAMIRADNTWRAVSGVLASGSYDVRVRFVSAAGRVSAWVYQRSIVA